MKKVGIVCVSISKFKSKEDKLSYKEIIFDVVKQAHNNAGLKKQDIQCIITSGEDLTEGRTIADEFTPDETGGANKPNVRISADAIYGIFTAFMQIQSGLFDVISIVGYEKPSDVINLEKVTSYALDPILVRPLNLNPIFLAGLEMSRFMNDFKISKKQIAEVVVKNKKNAVLNENAVYGENITVEDVLNSEVICEPLNKLDIADNIDGAVCVIVAEEKKAKKITKHPVWIQGIGWSSSSSSIFWDNLSNAKYIEHSAAKAYAMAGIKYPAKEIDFAEVDDRFSYKELQHIEALGICKKNESAKLLEKGYFNIDGKLPVNPSGGCLGIGNLHSGAGMLKIAESYLQLIEKKEKAQVKIKNKKAVVCAWNGLPSRSGGVVILGV